MVFLKLNKILYHLKIDINMKTQSLIGGRGKCQYCGKLVNNVSYHEEHECYKKIEGKIVWRPKARKYKKIIE